MMRKHKSFHACVVWDFARIVNQRLVTCNLLIWLLFFQLVLRFCLYYTVRWCNSEPSLHCKLRRTDFVSVKNNQYSTRGTSVFFIRVWPVSPTGLTPLFVLSRYEQVVVTAKSRFMLVNSKMYMQENMWAWRKWTIVCYERQ